MRSRCASAAHQKKERARARGAGTRTRAMPVRGGWVGGEGGHTAARARGDWQAPRASGLAARARRRAMPNADGFMDNEEAQALAGQGRPSADVIQRTTRLKCHDFMPAEVGCLINLKTIRAAAGPDFYQGELPELFGRLSSLQGLCISKNQLAALPESIGQLSSLQELQVFDNQLAALPESIGQLSSLKDLHVQDNKLTALLEAIEQSPSMSTSRAIS